MKTQTFIRVSGMILAVAAASLILLALTYALQNPQAMLTLSTVSWNGVVSY